MRVDGNVGKLAERVCYAFQRPGPGYVGDGSGQRVFALQDAQSGHEFDRVQAGVIKGCCLSFQTGFDSLRAIFQKVGRKVDVPDQKPCQMGAVCKKPLQQAATVSMTRHKASAVDKGLVGKQARLFLPAFKADTAASVSMISGKCSIWSRNTAPPTMS